MKRTLFYRNVRAGEQLDVFLISAIGSLLLTRFLLGLSGYPQLGGNGLHIGHMLWGGLFMLISIVINLAFLGMRARRLSAIIGGLGFGVFIDEIGKFITSDNDYFYRPAVGIIYAVFIVMYLTFNFISRKQRLTSREYQLNAMMHLEEAILHDMDPFEKERARSLLMRASRRSVITKELEELLERVDTVPPGQPLFLRRFLTTIDRMYVDLWKRRNTRTLVRVFFIAEVTLFVAAIMGNIYLNLDDINQAIYGRADYGTGLLVCQFVSSLVAAGFAVMGTLRLTASRLAAFEDFRRATLINLFLTEFFVFSRIEFQALPGFVFNVAVLAFISYVMHQERRTAQSHKTALGSNDL
jgi:hypothetical protein